MKLMVISLLILFVIPNIPSLEITEVELNPAGSDSGNEWIELFSEQEIQLNNYYLENNDKDIYNLTGTFINYLVIIFPSQWLDNSDEKIFLKKDNELIDETSLLEDSKNNDFSWQKCNDEWIFSLSTKGKESKCDEESDEPVKKEEKEISSTPKTSFTKIETLSSPNIPENNEILLNSPPKNKNPILITKQEKTRLAIIYSFAGLCLLLIILLALRKL